MNIVKDKTILKSIAKRYNLDFDLEFNYYIGGAYKDNKGNTLQNYFRGANNRIYILKYFSGCFNPYLVELNTKNKGFAVIKSDKQLQKVVRVYNEDSYNRYRELFGIPNVNLITFY